MGNEFLHGLGLDEIYRFSCSLAVHEVAHVDTALVDEHLQDVRIFEHVLDKACSGFGKGPVVVGIILRMVEQVDGVIVVLTTVESESKVGILHNEAPSLWKIYFCVIVGTPEYDIVAREVDIAVEEVHHHHVQILADVHPFLIFSQGMTFLAVEVLEFVIEFVVAFLQLLNEQVIVVNIFFVSKLNLVNILKTVVVTVDIVFVGTLADVEHAHIFAVDVEHGRVACLPVEVYMACHRALYDEVAEVEVAEVVTAVAK